MTASSWVRRAASSSLRLSPAQQQPPPPPLPKRNPFRPEIQLPAPPPRRAIVRKLKFGREVESYEQQSLGNDGSTATDGSAGAGSGSSAPTTTDASGFVGATPVTADQLPLNLNAHVPSGGRSNASTAAYAASHRAAADSASSSVRPSLSSSSWSQSASTSSSPASAPLGSSSSSRSSSTSSPSVGDSRKARYNPNNTGLSSSSLIWIAVAAVAVSGGYHLYSSGDGSDASVAKAREFAVSNEPYPTDYVQQILASYEAAPEDDPSQPMSARMEVWIKSLQDRICTAIERIEAEECLSTTSSAAQKEPGKFYRDSWLRKEGGEGISCVLQQGRVFEKSGVNVSVVYGELPPKAVEAMTADHEGKFKGWYDGKSLLPFKALGISCVMHPHNPVAPTVHFNYRYFEVEDPRKPGQPKAWWFGGGSDLTPSYLYPVDAEHFHTSIQSQCTLPQYPYSRFKQWCDEYFHIKHRGERRGLGGIFFDDLSAAPGDVRGREELFAWVRRCGEGFVESYVPIVKRRKNADFTQRMRQWQQLRRGRYVEFNLVYDRGTQFGLRTPGARIESILMSLPLTARWEYYAKLGTEPDSEEAKLLEVLRNPKDWAASPSSA